MAQPEGAEVKIHALLNIKREDGDYEILEVKDLEELFRICKGVDPGTYAFVEMQGTSEEGEFVDYLSLEVMP